MFSRLYPQHADLDELIVRCNLTEYLNQDNRYLSVPETQYVQFGFTYNFGNFRLEDNKRDIEKIERERL